MTISGREIVGCHLIANIFLAAVRLRSGLAKRNREAKTIWWYWNSSFEQIASHLCYLLPECNNIWAFPILMDICPQRIWWTEVRNGRYNDVHKMTLSGSKIHSLGKLVVYKSVVGIFRSVRRSSISSIFKNCTHVFLEQHHFKKILFFKHTKLKLFISQSVSLLQWSVCHV